MSDLSDPTVLPEESAGDKAWREYASVRGYADGSPVRWAFAEAWDSSRRHFAAELDGLRAQIEEAQKWCRENGAPGVYPQEPFTFEKGVSAAATDLLAILAQSPRGTIVRIQAEAIARGYNRGS